MSLEDVKKKFQMTYDDKRKSKILL